VELGRRQACCRSFTGPAGSFEAAAIKLDSFFFGLVDASQGVVRLREERETQRLECRCQAPRRGDGGAASAKPLQNS